MSDKKASSVFSERHQSLMEKLAKLQKEYLELKALSQYKDDSNNKLKPLASFESKDLQQSMILH